MISFNAEILSEAVQSYISKNLNTPISDLIFKGNPFPSIPFSEIINQIEAKNRCLKKLPTWYNGHNLYFPNKLNIEQPSSETTAKFKSELISGEHFIDLTGGFGVDDYYFSKRFNNVHHCDINDELSKIVVHNYKALSVTNIKCHSCNGIEVLKDLNQKFDWIYLDPSRRDDRKAKVFMLKDCLPNAPKFLGLFFKYSKHVMIKTSPLLDISSGINELQYVKTIYSIAFKNEVKELLWILEHDYKGDIAVKTTNISGRESQNFNFKLKQESIAEANYSEPLTYLYEPNSAILKTGAFNSIAIQLNLFKIHKHSHLYTSDTLIDFPGRRFKIVKSAVYKKKSFKRDFSLTKANVTTRNFPEQVSQIRKKLSLKDGGKDYLFFTTDKLGFKLVIHCFKVH
jgi:hypothetical protein